MFPICIPTMTILLSFVKIISRCLWLILCLFTLFNSIALADDGEWTHLGLEDTYVKSIVIDPFHPDTIFVGTSRVFMDSAVGGVFKSIDGGASWEITGLAGVSVLELAMNSKNPNIIYAACSAGSGWIPGIYKTEDGGESWVNASNGIWLDWETSVGSVALDPHHPDTVYASTYGFYGGGMYKSIDGGDTWEWESFNGGLNAAGYGSITIDPVNTNVIYMSSVNWGSGVYKSTNSGSTWTDMGFPSDITYEFAIDPLNTNILYIATGSVHKTINGGETWDDISEGLLETQYAKAIRMDPSNSSMLYIGIEPYVGSTGGVFKSTNAGSLWVAMNEGWDAPSVNCLAIHPHNRQIIYAGTYHDGVYHYTISTSVKDPSEEAQLPSSVLLQNYPNPFNERTIIKYEVLSPDQVALSVINILGQTVCTLVNEFKPAGQYSTSWDGTIGTGQEAASGLYFLHLQYGKISKVTKLLIIK